MSYNIAEKIFTLDPSHPNYIRWQRAIDTAAIRGELVVNILEQYIDLRGKNILDVGCGVGGTTIALNKREADVFSLDVNPKRLEYVRERMEKTSSTAANALQLPFKKKSFDVVILQDVIEHVNEPKILMSEIHRVLKSKGILYLTTPNKFSPINFISDPHWGLPIVASLNRKVVRFIMHTILHREKDRRDFAELLSFKALASLLTANSFSYRFNHSFIVKELFRKPSLVIWSGLHLSTVRWIKKVKFEKLIKKLVNDDDGIFNR